MASFLLKKSLCWVIEQESLKGPKHVFQPTGIIYKLVKDIIEMNLLTKFHEDRTANEKCPPLDSHTNLLTKFHEDRTIHLASRPYKKQCPAPGGHVFKVTKTIFELIQDITGTNLLTKRNASAPGIISELAQHIIGMNLLTEFHEDRTINVASRVINVASRVLTRFYYSHIQPYKENASPLGSHVVQANKAHVDATRRMTHDGQRAITKAHHEHIVLR
ncbi:hypothetical protein DPMN_145438 [Dreissena polymorpha]|uniref:Uncharacterized protein n=1 Tax=Dreissena polymorpha TaxID=45954 RepID=A0A9D4F4X9_DREPO|nr:hypothetical protein DPMN_145438 [Dreissena polymorpha]